MPLISSGSSHCNPSLNVSEKCLMSGISQQGVVAIHKLGTMAVVAKPETRDAFVE